MHRCLLAIAVAALCPLSPALGNGAFPDELSVMLPQNDPNRIYVGTNFGLVVSPDPGGTWRYVCEPYITGTLTDTITFYQAAKDGSILATSFGGFWRTTDGGCTWTRAAVNVSRPIARDLFVDPVDPTFVVAIVTDLEANRDGIHVSHDGGITFQGPIYSTPNRLSGVEIARANDSFLYATELRDTNIAAAQAFLVTSIDRGQTWNPPRPIVDESVPPGTEVTIAAVHPTDPNTVYLRLFNVAAGSDSIAVTSDRGQTLRPPAPFTIQGPTSFSTFLVAANGTLFAGTTSSQLYAAPAGSTSFTQRTGPRARCLGQRPGDPNAPVYACGDGFLDGYNLGVSIDGAQTFTPVMKFTDIAGPLTCPAVAQACAAQFAVLEQTLGVTRPSGAPAGGGTSAAPKSSGCSSAGGDGAILPGLLAAALAYLKRRASI